MRIQRPGAVCFGMALLLACLLLLSGCGREAAESSPPQMVESQTQAADTPSPEASQTAGPVVEHPDITGEWYRTNCHSECGATVVISEQTAEGFTVEADCYYGAHSGHLPESAACFTGETAGVMEVYGDYEYRSETGPKPPVEFTWDGDTMTITTEAQDLDLGFGVNVYIHGTYTRGEPEYTNAGQLDRLLSPEEQARLRAVAGENYDWDVARVLGNGTVETDVPCLLADGRRARYLSASYTPNWGYTLEVVLAEDGSTYFKGNIGFYTDDPNAAELPEVAWPVRDDTHDFFTVPTGGKLGTVLVTVELGELDEYNLLSPVTFSVWDTAAPTKPIQTFEERAMDLFHYNLMDANFDGHTDFTFVRHHGAQNGAHALFVWDEEQEQFVPKGEFWGGELTAREETQTVLNHIHISACSWAEDIYCWENGELIRMREVIVEEPLEGAQDLVIFEPVNGELEEVFRKTFSIDSSENPEDAGIYSEAVLWYDLSYHGET